LYSHLIFGCIDAFDLGENGRIDSGRGHFPIVIVVVHLK